MIGNNSHIARVNLLSSQKIENLRSTVVGLSDDQLFFWDAEISNDLLDSYYTHMSEKTLRNYADDAQKGIAFLAGHDWKSLPIGYSLSGAYEDVDRKKVIASFYTVRGLPETDSLILRMEAKILRDVSVGFHGGSTTCDICGRDFWDWDCYHMPGLYYVDENDKSKTVLSTWTIDDARLSEVSGVFDGATPEAMIRKAQDLAKRGEFTPQQVQFLGERYRIALTGATSFASNAIPGEKEEMVMNEEEVLRIRKMLGVSDNDKIFGAIELLQGRVVALEQRAQEGEQYRNDLIQSALEEGVRAQGNEFDRSLYEGALKDAPLSVVKRMRDDWKKMADTLLSAGRKSTDTETPAVKKSSLVPDSAYRV